MKTIPQTLSEVNKRFLKRERENELREKQDGTKGYLESLPKRLKLESKEN